MSSKMRQTKSVYYYQVLNAVVRANGAGTLAATVGEFARWAGLKDTHNLRSRLKQLEREGYFKFASPTNEFGTREHVMLFMPYIEMQEGQQCPF